MEGITCPEPLEHTVLDTALDGGLVEKISDWEPVAHPVLDTTLDGRPMEGTTDPEPLEHSVLARSLDSGLMDGMSSLELLEQSVLVARPMEEITEMDPSQSSALAMHLDYGHLNLESPARPMLEATRDGITDTDTDPSECSAFASHLDYGLLNLELLARPMVDVALDRRPTEGITVPLPVESSGLVMALGNGLTVDLSGSLPLEHLVSDMEVGNNRLDIHDEPLFGSDRGWSYLEFTDAMRQEALQIWSAGWVPAGSVDRMVVLPAEDYLCDKEMSINDVSSEDLRCGTTDMDIANQYETFSGLPAYYGGDMYDSEDLEEDDPVELARATYVEDYNFDIPEGMDLMVHKRCRPDDGEARSEDTVDMVPICQTVSCVTRIGPDEFSGTSGTETAVVNGHDLEDFYQWSELSDEEDCFVSDVGSSVDSSLYMSEQEDLGYVDVESVVDFDSEDFCINSDEGSVAELEWNTWDDA